MDVLPGISKNRPHLFLLWIPRMKADSILSLEAGQREPLLTPSNNSSTSSCPWLECPTKLLRRWCVANVPESFACARAGNSWAEKRSMQWDVIKSLKEALDFPWKLWVSPHRTVAGGGERAKVRSVASVANFLEKRCTFSRDALDIDWKVSAVYVKDTFVSASLPKRAPGDAVWVNAGSIWLDVVTVAKLSNKSMEHVIDQWRAAE